MAAYEVDGVTVYAKKTKGILKEYELDPLGKPVITNRNVGWHSGARPVLWWKGGIKGVAEFSYPHPRGWTYAQLDKIMDLDRMTVSVLTGAFSAIGKAIEPTCMTSWNKITSSWHITQAIDWEAFGQLFQNALATTKDLNLFLIHIVHRRIVMRSFMPMQDGYNKCRCCHAAKETHMHLHNCNTLWHAIWKPLRRLITSIYKPVTHTPSLTFLCISNTGELMPLAIRVFHAIIWKLFLIEFYKIGTENGYVFKSKDLFAFSARRYRSK